MPQLLRNLAGWLLTVACLGLFALTGTASAASDDILGPGDSVRITVFESPDLTTEARISSAGQIRFPLLGNVKLAGMTPSAAGERISALLGEGKIIRHAQVSVSIVEGRSQQVSVLGEVAKPGRYVLDETHATLTDILAQAGGITPTGDSIVTLVRTRNGQPERREIDVPRMYRTGDMSANIEIQSGDTVFVRKAPLFYIYGQVQKAGSYRLENEMTVMQAISLSGGLTLYGTERGIKIARRTADGGLTKKDAKVSDLVLADDIIYIQESLF